MADCHLGAWSNHPDLRELPLMAFEKPAAPAPGPRSGVPVISLLDY